MPKNKTDNFLKAIRRYAKQQKSVMKGEVKQLKTERLKEAEEKADQGQAAGDTHPSDRDPREKDAGRTEKALYRAFRDGGGSVQKGG